MKAKKNQTTTTNNTNNTTTKKENTMNRFESLFIRCTLEELEEAKKALEKVMAMKATKTTKTTKDTTTKEETKKTATTHKKEETPKSGTPDTTWKMAEIRQWVKDNGLTSKARSKVELLDKIQKELNTNTTTNTTKKADTTKKTTTKNTKKEEPKKEEIKYNTTTGQDTKGSWKNQCGEDISSKNIPSLKDTQEEKDDIREALEAADKDSLIYYLVQLDPSFQEKVNQKNYSKYFLIKEILKHRDSLVWEEACEEEEMEIA